MNKTEEVENNTEWDVIIVGGGPAGMMASAVASEKGARVLLLEKNESLGKKLLITGGGRCNVTNAELDERKFLRKFKENDKFLFSAFSQWSVKKTLDFFHSKKMDTKIENELRVFPTSDSAQSVWNTLVEYMKESGVTVLSNSQVTNIVTENKIITGVKLKNNKVIRGKSVIIATGGISRPETGSTGDAYGWLRELGHTVIEPAPSLVPVKTKEKWVQRVSGVSLPDVKITLLQGSEKQNSAKGKVLFTHLGLSGPGILNMSKDIGELLKYGEVQISLEIISLDHGILNSRLQEIFKENDKKKFKNSLGSLVPSSLAPVIVELSKINPETPCNSITRDERLHLVSVLKNVLLTVDSLLGVEKAIITSGGIELTEIDFKTMCSRLFPNLFVVGDMLNIDRPSGGYSLQLCWTTGFVAGTHASMVV